MVWQKAFTLLRLAGEWQAAAVRIKRT